MTISVNEQLESTVEIAVLDLPLVCKEHLLWFLQNNSESSWFAKHMTISVNEQLESTVQIAVLDLPQVCKEHLLWFLQNNSESSWFVNFLYQLFIPKDIAHN